MKDENLPVLNLFTLDKQILRFVALLVVIYDKRKFTTRLYAFVR